MNDRLGIDTVVCQSTSIVQHPTVQQQTHQLRRHTLSIAEFSFDTCQGIVGSGMYNILLSFPKGFDQNIHHHLLLSRGLFSRKKIVLSFPPFLFRRKSYVLRGWRLILKIHGVHFLKELVLIAILLLDVDTQRL